MMPIQLSGNIGRSGNGGQGNVSFYIPDRHANVVKTTEQ